MSLVEKLSVLLCEESDEGVEAVRMCCDQHVTEFPFSPVADILEDLMTGSGDADDTATSSPLAPCTARDGPRFKADDTVVVLYSTSGALLSGGGLVEQDISGSSPGRGGGGSNASSPGRSFYARGNETSFMAGMSDPGGIGRTRLGILTEATRAEHDDLVQLNRPMRYVLIYNNVATALSAVDAENGDISNESLCVVRHDSQPERVNTSGKRGMAIVTRTSAPLQRARDLVASVERGGTKIDVDSALTDCCNWLFESIILVEDEFEQVIGEAVTSAFALVDAVNRKFLSLALLRDFVLGGGNIFQQLEKLVAPSSAAKQRWDQRKSHLTITHGTAKLEARWMQLLSTPLLTLKLTNTARSQTLAPLRRVVEQVNSALVLIFCAAPSGLESDILSSPHATGAHTTAAGSRSGLHGDAASIAARIQSLNATSIQSNSVIDSELHIHATSLVQSHLLHYLRTYVIPAIGVDLLSKTEELLDLPSNLSMEREDLMHLYNKQQHGADEGTAAAAPAAGDPDIEEGGGGYMVPVATRPAKIQHLKDSAAILTFWSQAVERLSAFMVPDQYQQGQQEGGDTSATTGTATGGSKNLKLLQFDPRRSLALQLHEMGGGQGDELEPTTLRWSALSESVLLSHVRYAAERCIDISKHLAIIENTGHGNVSPFIRVLYKTLHRASRAFPLLRSSQYRNWQSYVYAFEKCLALKFEVVESVPYPLVQEEFGDDIPEDKSELAADNTAAGLDAAPLVDPTAALRQRVRSAGRHRPSSARGGNQGLGQGRTMANQSVMSLGSVNVSVISNAETAHDNQNRTHHSHHPSTAMIPSGNHSVANVTTGGGATMEVALLHEERGILSSRVTVLTEELIECRALLQAMEVQVAKSHRSMTASEELNLVLIAELRALKASQYEQLAVMPQALGVDAVINHPHPKVLEHQQQPWQGAAELLAPCSALLDDVEDYDDTDSSVSSADTYTSSDNDLDEDLALLLQKYPPLHPPTPEEQETPHLREQLAVRTTEREMKRRQRIDGVEANVLVRMEKRYLKRRNNIQKRKMGRLASANKQRRKLERRETKRRIVLAAACERKVRQIFTMMDRTVYQSPPVVDMSPSSGLEVAPASNQTSPEVSPSRALTTTGDRPGSPIGAEEQRQMEREQLVREMVAQSLATAAYNSDQRDKQQAEEVSK